MKNGESSGSRLLQSMKDRPIDPGASVLGAALTALCILHVPSRLEITADDLGALLCAAATLAAGGRAWWHGRGR